MSSKNRINRKNKKQVERETEYVLNSKFRMEKISPLTENQAEVFDLYEAGYNMVLHGSAGTGKSFLSTYLALKDVFEKKEYRKLIIIRSAVQTRDQGAVPGELKDKSAMYEEPYIPLINNLFSRGDAYEILKQKGMLEFTTTSNIRGLTWDNSIIVADEAQNMNYEELRTIITRVGENSRIIFCGDTKQDDLQNTRNRSDISGIKRFMNILKAMKKIGTVEFGPDDIVRSGIVKDFILAEEAAAMSHAA